MLMDATGDPVTAAGDSFVEHMDREALNDYPMGLYDVSVTITTFVLNQEIAWTVLGQLRPQIGHVYGYTLEPVDGGTRVTSYYDWSNIDEAYRDAGIFPVISGRAVLVLEVNRNGTTGVNSRSPGNTAASASTAPTSHAGPTGRRPHR
jgi:hypothetical protein